MIPAVGSRFDRATVEAVDVGRWATYVFVRPKPGVAGRWAVACRHPQPAVQLTLELGVA